MMLLLLALLVVYPLIRWDIQICKVDPFLLLGLKVYGKKLGIVEKPNMKDGPFYYLTEK